LKNGIGKVNNVGVALRKENADLRAKLAKATATLKRLEWRELCYNSPCSDCLGEKPNHEPFCGLGNIIKELEK
jgi:hypothetical protein